MVLWIVGGGKRRGHPRDSNGDSCSQSAISAELECLVLASWGRAAGRAQILVSGGGACPGTQLSCFWGWTGLFLKGSEGVRASVGQGWGSTTAGTRVPSGCGAGTLFLILVRVLPLSWGKTALKAENSVVCS